MANPANVKLRSEVLRPLTYSEVDANFSELKTTIGEVNTLAVNQGKLDLISVTGAVDLDSINSRVNSLDAAVVLRGVWDASVGTFPGTGTAQAGDSWIVSVSGVVNGIDFVANDRIIAILDNASTTVYVGNWHKADYTDISVNAAISASTEKTTPVDGDLVGIVDSAESGALKKLTWGNVKSNLKSGDATGAYNFLTGAAIASAPTINLETATGNRVHITGTTTITAVTLTKGPRTVIFDGVLTLTHHATNNNLPGAANITTAAGDRAVYESDGVTVYCTSYTKANGQSVVINTDGLGVHDFTASGSITAGKAVLLQNNGTVVQSLIADASLGSVISTTENIPKATSTCYHPPSGKFVVFYIDSSDSNHGKAIVGTVSGSGVSFGLPVTFEASALYAGNSVLDSCYDEDTGQIIVAYSNSVNQGVLKTCNVSEGVPSFGAALITGVGATEIGVCYDTSVNRVLFAHKDGAAQKAMVISVTGTTLATVTTNTLVGDVNGYTSAVVHCKGHSTAGYNVVAYNAGGSCFIMQVRIDPTTYAITPQTGTSVTDASGYTGYAWGKALAWSEALQRLIVLYENGPSGPYWLSVNLHQISGTSFTRTATSSVDVSGSYSTPYQNFVSVACSPDGLRLCVVFPDAGSTYYGKLVFSTTFTASSLGFTAEFQFQTSNVGWTSLDFTSDSAKALVAYSITSSVGRAVVATAPVSDRRTAFIGFAKETVADGAQVTVDLLGSVNSNQTGLTANNNYYLSSTDGITLTTTVNGPKVGKSLSATELLVLGSNLTT